MSRLGEKLKTLREEQGIALEQVEETLHIRRHLLEALEANNFKQFPSPVVVRGLIRNYAKFLNFDPIEALTLYDGNGIIPVKGQRLTPNGIEFMSLSMAPRPLFNWDLLVGLALFMLVLGGFGYVTYTTVIQPGLTPTPTKTPNPDGLDENSAFLLPTNTPLPTDTPTPLPPTETPTPIIYSGVTVELALSQPSWIQILADDVKTFEGVLQPGDRKIWTGQRRVAIRAGNAGGVEVIVNGTSRGLMGAVNQVVDQIWEKVEDPATLTPQPGQTVDSNPVNNLLPTETAPAVVETPVPLESAPTPEPSAAQTPQP